MKYIITESQHKKLEESINIKNLNLIRYIKNLLNKEDSSYISNTEVTPELKKEMELILKMIFDMVKNDLNLKLIKDVELLKINLRSSNDTQHILNIVKPITFSWVNESSIDYAREYEQLKAAFYDFQEKSGINFRNNITKRLVRFAFEWDMSHRVKVPSSH